MPQSITTNITSRDQTVLELNPDVSSRQLCVSGQTPHPGSLIHHLQNEAHSLPVRVLVDMNVECEPFGDTECSTTYPLSLLSAHKEYVILKVLWE